MNTSLKMKVINRSLEILKTDIHFIDYATCTIHMIVLVDRAMLNRSQQTIIAYPRWRDLIVWQ